MRLIIGTEDGLFCDEQHSLAGRRVQWLQPDRSSWWVVADNAVMRGVPDAWRQVAVVDGATCLLPANGGALLGTTGPHLSRVTDGRFEPVPGFESVPDREQWHAVGSRAPYVRSLTATADGVLLANVHVGGIPRSTDQGRTWHPTIDVEADVHQVRAHPERPELVVAAAAVGLCRSTDRGATWTVSDDGLHASYARAVAFAGDVLLMSASTGPFTHEGAVYRRRADGDEPFRRCAEGLPEWLPHNVDTGCLDARGDLAAFGGRDGTVYVSENAGATWQVHETGMPAITAVQIA